MLALLSGPESHVSELYVKLISAVLFGKLELHPFDSGAHLL